MRQRGIASPVTSKLGLSARLRYLDSPVGRDALWEAGSGSASCASGPAVVPRSPGKSVSSARRPTRRTGTAARTASCGAGGSIGTEQLRARDTDGDLPRRPVPREAQVSVPRVSQGSIRVRYGWDDTFADGADGTLDDIWDDVIADLDSDWVAHANANGIQRLTYGRAHLAMWCPGRRPAAMRR